MARQPSRDRLLRLLALPAWIASHPGVTIEQAAQHFDVSVPVIIQDINSLWMSGRGRHRPDESVDFDAYAHDEGRLHLTRSLGLDRPLTLTSDEARCLILALRVLAPLVQSDPQTYADLTSALTVLTGLLGDAEGESTAQAPLADAGVAAMTSTQVSAAVRDALASQRCLALHYVSATDEASHRIVDPYDLTSDGSHMYLHAWCQQAQAQRSFRLDRILTATVLDQRSKRRRPGSHNTDNRPRATFRLSRGGAWLAEQIPCESVTPHRDGTVSVVVQGRDWAWLTTLGLSYGAHIVAVEPPALAADIAAQAQAALAAYDGLEHCRNGIDTDSAEREQ